MASQIEKADMPLLLLLFLACIFTISVCSAWLFGTFSKRFDLTGALMGLALAPALTGFAVYIELACFAYFAPSRILFGILPVVAIAALAYLFGRRSVMADSFYPAATQPLIYGGLLLIAAFPVISLLLARAAQNEVPHDLTTYFLQAIDLNRMMRSGATSMFEWWTYKHPFISQPHSLSYPILLAWGFIFVDVPGYGADYLPKLLVAWTIVSLVIACISVAAVFGMPWGFAAGIFVLVNNSLPSEIWALSRDSFYLAPLFVLIALLARARPLERESQTPLLLRQSIALIATLSGHTLGIVYGSSLIAAYGLVTAFRLKGKIFQDTSIWVMGSIVAVGCVATLFRYFHADAASIGFEFPYYVDPFQASVLNTVAPFSVDSSITKLFGIVLSSNGIDQRWLLLVAFAAFIVLPRFFRSPDNKLDIIWLLVALSILACSLIVSFAPMRLEGLSLGSAFAVNFRYGFGLGLLVQLLIVCSLAILSNSVLGNRSLRFAPLIVGSIALVFAATVYYSRTANWRVYPEDASSPSRQRDRACQIAMERRPRRILIDDTNMLYVCRGSFVNAYSNQGILITGAVGSEDIAAALDAQEIDAVVFYTAPSRWSGTRLNQYLKQYWANPYTEPNRAVVYLRP